MQLIDIIFNVLLFGGALLIVVVFFSYLLSKSRGEDEPYKKLESTDKPNNSRANKLEQPTIRYQQSNVIPLYNSAPKELKVVRKPTVAKREPPQNLYEHERIPKRKTNGNGQRYTIVNEEMQKTRKPRVINFYL